MAPPRSPPMLRSFLVPKIMTTMANTTSQCQMLNEPIMTLRLKRIDLWRKNCSCVCPVKEASFTDGFALRTSAIHGGRILAFTNLKSGQTSATQDMQVQVQDFLSPTAPGIDNGTVTVRQSSTRATSGTVRNMCAINPSCADVRSSGFRHVRVAPSADAPAPSGRCP